MIDVSVRYAHFWDIPGFRGVIVGALLLAGAVIVKRLFPKMKVLGIGNVVTLFAGTIGTILLLLSLGFMFSPTFDTGKLESAYGIEQLECSDNTCTWLKDGQPAAGTLVQRGDMAGLLDSNQTPLPVVGKGAQ